MGQSSSSETLRAPDRVPGSWSDGDREEDISLQIKIFYFSLSRTTKTLATRLEELLSRQISSIPTSSSASAGKSNKVELINLDEYDHDLILSQKSTDSVLAINLFLLPSYNIETPLDSILAFFEDAVNDFRLSKDCLSQVGFAVLGVGHKDYGKKEFGEQGRKLDEWLADLGGRRIRAFGLADSSIDPEKDMDIWFTSLLQPLSNVLSSGFSTFPSSAITPSMSQPQDASDEEVGEEESSGETEEDGSSATTPASGEDEDEFEGKSSAPTSKEIAKQKLQAARALRQSKRKNSGKTSNAEPNEMELANEEDEEEDDDVNHKKDVEIEDIGKSMPKMQAAIRKKAEQEALYRNSLSPASSKAKVSLSSTDPTATKKAVERAEPKEMVSPLTRKTLTKQGYSIIGSHSGVKTCRWTKAALRGRGFCYKKAFYGIDSHRCMETTPSLACANKCTFCWRSHSNPVGVTWRWKIDDADFLVDGALKEHDRMIKQLAGMPDVRSDRFQEARIPRHAALSLVGEPVFYPQINRYIELLHQKHISTFVVTNAQFVEPLRKLPPVTQLYLSIDAGTKESLKKIDRPLHRDFWERFLACIDIVREKKIRTVYRLTLVKEWNTEELEAYADLIRRGQPDFIEVKGVTYCGYAGSSDLSIKNSPFHEEVVSFVQNLVNLLPDQYGLACEHAHSCCVLAASKRFFINDEWHTWIDYDHFFELVEKGEPFEALDYACPTPEWAVFGSNEAGFSPDDTRWHRKKKDTAAPVADS